MIKGRLMNTQILCKTLLLTSSIVSIIYATNTVAEELAPPPGPYRTFSNEAPVVTQNTVRPNQMQQAPAPVMNQRRRVMPQQNWNAPGFERPPAWVNQTPNWELPEVPDWVKQRQDEMRKRVEAAQNQQAEMEKNMAAMPHDYQPEQWKQPEPPEWVKQQRAEIEKQRHEDVQRPDWSQQRPEWKQPEPPEWVKQQRAEIEKQRQEDVQRPDWSQQRSEWKQPELPEWVVKQREEMRKQQDERPTATEYKKPEMPEWVKKQRAEAEKQFAERHNPQNWQQGSWGQRPQWRPRELPTREMPDWVNQQREEADKRRAEMPQQVWGQNSPWSRPTRPDWVTQQRAEMEKQMAEAPRQPTWGSQNPNWQRPEPPAWVSQQREEMKKRRAEVEQQRPGEIPRWRTDEEDAKAAEEAAQNQPPVNPGYFGAPNRYGPSFGLPRAPGDYGYDPRRFNPWSSRGPVWGRP